MRVPAGVTISGPLIDICRPSLLAHHSPSIASAQAPPETSSPVAASAAVRNCLAIAFILSNADDAEHSANPPAAAPRLKEFSRDLEILAMLIAVRWKPSVALLLLGLTFAAPSFAQPAAATPAEQAADDLNSEVLRVYRAAKKVRLAQASPVIVVAFGEAVLIRAGSEQRVDFTPRGYDSFK